MVWCRTSFIKVLQIKKLETNILVPTLKIIGVGSRNSNISRWNVIMLKDIIPVFIDIFAFKKRFIKPTISLSASTVYGNIAWFHVHMRNPL